MKYGIPENWDRSVLENALERASFRTLNKFDRQGFAGAGYDALIAEIDDGDGLGATLLIDKGIISVIGLDANEEIFQIDFTQSGEDEGERIV